MESQLQAFENQISVFKKEFLDQFRHELSDLITVFIEGGFNGIATRRSNVSGYYAGHELVKAQEVVYLDTLLSVYGDVNHYKNFYGKVLFAIATKTFKHSQVPSLRAVNPIDSGFCDPFWSNISDEERRKLKEILVDEIKGVLDNDPDVDDNSMLCKLSLGVYSEPVIFSECCDLARRQLAEKKRESLGLLRTIYSRFITGEIRLILNDNPNCTVADVLTHIENTYGKVEHGLVDVTLCHIRAKSMDFAAGHDDPFESLKIQFNKYLSSACVGNLYEGMTTKRINIITHFCKLLEETPDLC